MSDFINKDIKMNKGEKADDDPRDEMVRMYRDYLTSQTSISELEAAQRLDRFKKEVYAKKS